MTDNQIKLLKEALLEEDLREMAIIDSLPDEEFVFSEKYKKEMQKLLNKHKKYTRNSNRFIPKRLVGVLVAILITLTLMMSISAIREPVVKFIVNMYDSFISIFIEEDKGAKPPQEIENMYLPTDGIQGYRIQSSYNQGKISSTVWINDNNEMVFLEQSVLENNYQAFIDNESMYYKTTVIDIYEVYYTEKNSSFGVVWSNGEYMFKMLFPNTIEFQEIEDIIISFEIVED